MIEAMKQALEIIKNMRSGYGDDYPTEKERKTITALRQAIEEAEKQEPVAWIQEDRIVPELGYDCTMTREHPKELGYTPLYTAPPQAEKQEPVAWMLDFIDDGFEVKDFVVTKPEYIGAGYNVRPLYTAPSRKEWVGLTDEEILQTLGGKTGDEYFFKFVRAVEAKLKEKNT